TLTLPEHEAPLAVTAVNEITYTRPLPPPPALHPHRGHAVLDRGVGTRAAVAAVLDRLVLGDAGGRDHDPSPAGIDHAADLDRYELVIRRPDLGHQGDGTAAVEDASCQRRRDRASNAFPVAV